MKLTRKDLVRAQDAQLRVLGVIRKNNGGWLKKTIERDFDPGLIAMFHKARRKTKADAPKSTRPNRWERKPVVSITDKFLREFDARFKEHSAKVKDGTAVPEVCEVMDFLKGVADFLREGRDPFSMPRVDVSKLGPQVAALPNPHDSPSSIPLFPDTMEYPSAEVFAAQDAESARVNQSPESFSNTLFEQEGRDLA